MEVRSDRAAGPVRSVGGSHFLMFKIRWRLAGIVGVFDYDVIPLLAFLCLSNPLSGVGCRQDLLVGLQHGVDEPLVTAAERDGLADCLTDGTTSQVCYLQANIYVTKLVTSYHTAI